MVGFKGRRKVAASKVIKTMGNAVIRPEQQKPSPGP